MGILRSRLFGISRRETLFATRGFPDCPALARKHLERIGAAFVDGYNAALDRGLNDGLISTLDDTGTELRGFAYEGAAMAFALLDTLTPWQRNRVGQFLLEADHHVYMIHVGIGFALARLKRPIEAAMARMHPLYRWLVVDGYGFHQGFFHHAEAFDQQRVPARISGYARRVFDQGLGRSLWFVAGAQSVRIIQHIENFPADRRADLWSGVGLACAYAGGTSRAGLERLCNAAGENLAHFAQGAAFAAKARVRADMIMPHTDSTCRAACNLSARDAAELTDMAKEGLPEVDADSSAAEPAYETWRGRVRDACALATGSAAA